MEGHVRKTGTTVGNTFYTRGSKITWYDFEIFLCLAINVSYFRPLVVEGIREYT